MARLTKDQFVSANAAVTKDIEVDGIGTVGIRLMSLEETQQYISEDEKIEDTMHKSALLCSYIIADENNDRMFSDYKEVLSAVKASKAQEIVDKASAFIGFASDEEIEAAAKN